MFFHSHQWSDTQIMNISECQRNLYQQCNNCGKVKILERVYNHQFDKDLVRIVDFKRSEGHYNGTDTWEGKVESKTCSKCGYVHKTELML